MSRPEHYSLEIAARCQRLIEQLTGRIDEDSLLVDEWGGPLRTTFLLAMSAPMVVLPMERLFRPLFSKAGVADDTALDPALADRVRDTLGPDRRFEEARFYLPNAWSYAPAIAPFPVAEAWPAAIFDLLSAAEAKAAAASAPAADVLECLRNALAHGGVAYLDRSGRQTDHATDMLAFAARTRDRKNLQLLRVRIDDYQQFLRAWTAWLADRRVEASLAEMGPGWFDEAAA
jgi:hypothetical protein